MYFCKEVITPMLMVMAFHLQNVFLFIKLFDHSIGNTIFEVVIEFTKKKRYLGID